MLPQPHVKYVLQIVRLEQRQEEGKQACQEVIALACSLSATEGGSARQNPTGIIFEELLDHVHGQKLWK
jgi:hypothetical protein